MVSKSIKYEQKCYNKHIKIERVRKHCNEKNRINYKSLESSKKEANTRYSMIKNMSYL